MAKLGVIGGGVMAEAIVSRLIAQKQYAPPEILISDPVAERRAFLTQTYGVTTTEENGEVAQSEVLLLAIKPQVFSVIAEELHSIVHPEDQLVLSILAGVPLGKLDSGLPRRAILRAMPNTPATVGAGITALAAGAMVTPDQMETAQRLFAAIGDVVVVPESLMDAVTGLSGSGPAYVALLVEALADGGVAAGLPRNIAQQLALQTVRGTAELLHETNCHPAILKDQVCSPGGTTIAGVKALENRGFRAAVMDAVQAAAQRSKELGN